MPGRRAERRRRNAEALIRAADRLFTEHGYRAVRIEEIAEAAGMTTGAIYSIFGSKRALLRAVLGSRIDRIADDTRAARADEQLSAVEVVAAYARAHCRLVAADCLRALRLEIEALALWLQGGWRTEELAAQAERSGLATALTGRRVGTGADRRLTAAEAATLATAETALFTGLARTCALARIAPDPDLWARAAIALATVVDGALDAAPPDA
ncbi:transcriptional regulator, TetR family [Pseudonocardia thermophila]|uniref:Transcriptional regulator, TetR family n=1 Tax=Pseudonocardia thermophila TaxID=1848 RepID=A0A1M6P321_PSETH|nr:TetR/AcrR family transcriptional regulator [Pseudonocardia thermophila]SHK02293.1 transcriptional regulator, TetR family [Pseudonocardia thermophila]